MSRETHRSVCSLLLAACATTTAVWAMPASALTEPTGQVESAATIQPTRVLDHAASLIADGQLIRAKAMLDALHASPAAATMGMTRAQAALDTPLGR